MNTMSKIITLSIILTVSGYSIGFASGSFPQSTGTDTRMLSLQDAVRMALSRSPEVLIAESQELQSDAAVLESRSLNRPQVVAGTGFAYNNGFPLSIEGAAPSIFQVGLSQSILSKRNTNLIREAEAEGKSSRFNKEAAENGLAARTALAYFRLYQARRMITLAAERIAAAESFLEITKSLSQAGRIRSVDLNSATMALSSTRQQLLVLEEEAKLAEIELRNYTGIPVSVALQLKEPGIQSPDFEEDAESLYRRILENSPEIQRAEADIRAKEFHLEAEKGERLPQLKVVGEYALLSRSNNYEDYFNSFERHNYLFGFTLQVPVFDGFRASSRIVQSRQQVSEANLRLESVKSDLKLNLQRGLSALRIARGANMLAQSEVDAIREQVQVDKELLENGRISRMEFEETMTVLYEKELNRLEAEQVLFQRELELLNITGDLSSVF